MHDSNHDILKAIRYELCHSNIKWTGSYIKGHQDDQIPFHNLDRPSQLNVIMDQKAKNFLASITESHRHYDVYSNSWRLRIGNHPVIHDFDRTIYDIAHTPVVKQYWMNKSRIQDQHFTSVNWQRLGTALDRMPFSRRIFCTKHTSGMCGVGKFQKIWKTRETAACPHCGLFEDSLHVWKCTSPTVVDVWSNSLLNLQRALHKIDTDPILITCILQYLNTWRSDLHLRPMENTRYQRILDLQDSIGARCEYTLRIYSKCTYVVGYK
jgi:hypothetical protein